MPKPSAPFDLWRTLQRAAVGFSRQYAAWNAEPPGGKGRTIAAIAAHMHNVRHMWLVAAAKGIHCRSKPPSGCGSGECVGKSAAKWGGTPVLRPASTPASVDAAMR
jgi:hypothetical protein